MSPERALRPENFQLLEELENLKGDPHASLVAMQVALKVDIGVQLGFATGIVARQPEDIRTVPLTPTQYEAIKSLEDIVKVFCKHAVLDPEEFGFWFKAPTSVFRNHSPIELLFAEVTENGFDKNTVRFIVTEAARIFFVRSDEALQDMRALYAS